MTKRPTLHPRQYITPKETLQAYTDLAITWADCTSCPCHLTAHRKVHHRGGLPAPLALVGEAPGESEDVLGVPFIGPAGRLLDHLLAEAEIRPEDVAIFNTVACMPRSDSGGIRAPVKAEVQACQIRLKTLLQISGASVVLALGSTARQALAWAGITAKHIVHPAYLIRLAQDNPGQYWVDYSAALGTLRRVYKEALQ